MINKIASGQHVQHFTIFSTYDSRLKLAGMYTDLYSTNSAIYAQTFKWTNSRFCSNTNNNLQEKRKKEGMVHYITISSHIRVNMYID